MVGRDSWRKGLAFILGLSLCATFLFTAVGAQPRAGFLDTVRDSFSTGFRAITGGGRQADGDAAVIRVRSPRAYALEQDERRRDRELVRVGVHEFHPGIEEAVPQKTLPELLAPRTQIVPPELAGTLAGDEEYWIFQYEGASQKAREAIEATGATIVEWVPNAAYLARVSQDELAASRALSQVTWAGPFLPAYKVRGDLLELVDTVDTTRMPLDELGRVRLLVGFFADSDPASYLDDIKRVPGVEMRGSGISVPDMAARLSVGPESLREAIVELAFLRDVLSIEPDPMPRPDLDNTVWWMQTGIELQTNYDTAARLFALGINGQGLMGAAADSGVENDLCQFRYRGNNPALSVNEAAWVIGPDDSDIPRTPDEGGDLPDDFTVPPPQRTRARKVVAYYLMTGATPYESAPPEGPHGTQVASCMVGDNNSVLAARPLIRDLGVRQNVVGRKIGGEWTLGQELRDDIQPRVDDTTVSEPTFPTTYGVNVQHHQLADGMAPGAQLVFQDVGNDSGLGAAFDDVTLYWQAHETGATVHNTSFGQGPCNPATCYGTRARNVDRVAWSFRDYVIVSSAGNDGDLGAATIGGGFAQGANVIAVGASANANSLSDPPATRRGENIAGFSSKGPKAGGLLAPDLIATGILSAATEVGSDPTPEDGTGSGNGGCGRTVLGQITGTSFSSPVLGGAALLVQQYFLDGWYPNGEPTGEDEFRPTNALVRAIMTNSARNLLGGRTDDTGLGQAPRPNFGQGWGAPKLDDTLYFAGDPPLLVDPRGDTQRARLLVLTDTPNGANGTFPLSMEPGGRLRSDIVASYKPTISDQVIHDFTVNIVRTDFDGDGTLVDPGNELRITLAYMDERGAVAVPLQNDLDLEVISPGPDGVLQSDGTMLPDVRRGDDVVYRTNPLTSWADGFSIPAADQELQRLNPGFSNYTDRDNLNPVENVFVKAEDVVSGTWRIRVIGYDIPGVDGTDGGRPNLIEGDLGPSLDTDGDTVNDLELFDTVRGRDQGYALVMSGNFTTTQGLVSLNRSAFDCSGQDLIVTLNDENGDAPRSACDPGTGPLDDTLTVDVTTSTPNRGFPSDLEVLEVFSTVGGGPPTYQSDPISVYVTTDPAEVIHGNGRVEIAPDEVIIASYTDGDPCGGTAFAQATVGCRPAVTDEGFNIEDGCDRANPADPMSSLRPDDFMDRGELVRYTVFFGNTGDLMMDAQVSLTPDPLDPVSQYVTVLNSPRRVGQAPPGRRSDAIFLVQLDDTVNIPEQYSLDFEVCISSPADGLLFPDCFTQTQFLESDIQVFRYDTRDPNGELYGVNRIRWGLPGVDEDMSTDPNDFFENAPMWFDPDADCDPGAAFVACASVCGGIPRDQWVPGVNPPPICFGAGVATDNPTNPWDFDDSDEGFVIAAHDGDPVIGVAPLEEWFWKTSPDGGGCGWEDELHRQLATNGDPLPAGHPDNFTQPWGIWHTGAINQAAVGPYNGDPTITQGVPFFEDPDVGDASPRDHSIMIGPPDPEALTDNTAGQWCNTYLSETGQGNFYRSFLIPPALNRVHRQSPDFTVNFERLRFYTRMDGHTIDGDNLSIAGWFVQNEPVAPVGTVPIDTYSWAQYQYGTIIFSDKVRERWDEDDNTIDIGLAQPDEDFPDRSYEDIFGPASDSWNLAFSWGHLHFDGYPSKMGYGWGIDDVSFVWTESRAQPDASECRPGGGPTVQPATVFFTETRYNACAGTLDIVVIDEAQAADEIAVCVTSAAEDREVAFLTVTDRAAGRFEGEMPFTTDPREEALGILLASAGNTDIGNGGDTIRVEYDPRSPDSDVAVGEADPDETCDWEDINPPDGRNDDDDGDGVPNAEDDVDREFERADTSVINCTSGRIYFIKHQLQQDGPGDGDRFADHGEVQFLSVSLLSALGTDLRDVTVTISTEDTTVCIVDDTVELETLPAGMVTDTPLGVDGFKFGVPDAVRTTALDAPQTVSFRIDVVGTRTDNLNEYSSRGDAFSSYLPQVAWLVLDVDEVPTAPDWDDNPGTNLTNGRTGLRPPGEWRDGFEGAPAVLGFEHPRREDQFPGPRVLELDATTDTRFGVDQNMGWCPECDALTECVLGEDCDYLFRPGDYENSSEWALTSQWAKEVNPDQGYVGAGSYKFGRPNAGPNQPDQHYAEGQFTALELPPMRIANTFPAGENPELRFWHISNFWRPFFTSGLITPIGSGVIEISAHPVGVGPTRQEQADGDLIDAVHPTSSFRRIYPVENTYENETDPLNACRTFFCEYHHPVFVDQGSFLTAPASGSDPRRGSLGGTWNEVVVDLSDYRGMEVVIRFTTQVMSDLDIQAGQFGWVVDFVRILGVSNDLALQLQANDTGIDPCDLVAEFASTSPDCSTGAVQFFDRHSGLGLFDGGTGQPFPLEYEWDVNGSNVVPRGSAGVAVVGVTGVRGTYDNPRINLGAAAGVGPGIHQVAMRLYQNGMQVGQVTHDVVYRDAPVPILTLASAGPFANAESRFTAEVNFNAAIDPDRSFTYQWDFGDGSGTQSTGADVTHVYETTGTFDVTLTIIDEEGCVGTSTTTVTVAEGPRFSAPSVAATIDECPAGTGDGNADLNEYVTIDVSFDNLGPLATNVVGHLTSADPAVEIVRNVTDYGSVATGPSPAGSFQFIRREVAGEDLSCIVVPFTLTLVSDGGAVVQALEFTYTMGGAVDSFYVEPGGPLVDGGTLGESVTFQFQPDQDGCVNGLELQVDIEVFGTTLMDAITVDLFTPEFRRLPPLKSQFTGGTARTWTIDFAFGADDGDAPIRDTGGVVDDLGDGLPTATRAALLSTVAGSPMRVVPAQPWELVITAVNPTGPNPAGQFTATVNTFALEGTLSSDPDVLPEPDCTTCVTTEPAPPVWEGAYSSCVDGGRLLWSPPHDGSTCGGATDIDYELYVSDTAGQLGTPATILPDDPGLTDEENCAMNCPTGDCAVGRGREATTWKVCDVETWYWTVIAIDGTTGARSPDLDGVDPMANPGTFQVEPGSCALPPGAPIIGLVRSAGSTLTLHLNNPGVPNLPLLRPAPNATEHRLLRGTFPVDPGDGMLRTLGSRALAYDHQDYAGCGFPGLTEDMSDQLDAGANPGSFYYLVGGVNVTGCAGLDVPSDLPAPGRRGAPRPDDMDGCGACAP